MRVLVTTTGSAGHFGPLVPFVDAIRAAGDDVLVATRESSAGRVRAAGYEVWPFADAPAAERDAIFASLRDLPLDEANLRVGVDVFGRLDTRAALPGILDACAAWQPHLVLSEVAGFAGLLAGAHLGVPIVTAAISLAATELRFMDPIRRALDDVRAELGLDAGAAPAAIDALAPLPVRVLVTVGRDRDPAELGPLPGNVHAERWIPQADVLPHAAALLCHGGFGTVRGALAAGVPVAVLPLFADQPYNARRVAEIGAGIALEHDVAGAADAVRALLADPRYADRAAAVAADVRALPPVDAAVDVLHDLARTAGPSR